MQAVVIKKRVGRRTRAAFLFLFHHSWTSELIVRCLYLILLSLPARHSLNLLVALLLRLASCNVTSPRGLSSAHALTLDMAAYKEFGYLFFVRGRPPIVEVTPTEHQHKLDAV